MSEMVYKVRRCIRRLKCLLQMRDIIQRGIHLISIKLKVGHILLRREMSTVFLRFISPAYFYIWYGILTHYNSISYLVLISTYLTGDFNYIFHFIYCNFFFTFYFLLDSLGLLTPFSVRKGTEERNRRRPCVDKSS